LETLSNKRLRGKKKETTGEEERTWLHESSLYIYLDKILPGTSARIVAKKVVADMPVIMPIADCSFFTGKCPVDWSGELTCPDVITTGSPWRGPNLVSVNFFPLHRQVMCLLEGRNFSAIIEEIQLKFWPHIHGEVPSLFCILLGSLQQN